MDTSVLEDLGLSKAEIKTYLALLELGSVTAGPVIEKSGLQSSVFYNAIHSLLEKGFVTYIKKGKIKYYQATDPSNVLDFIEDKKKTFKELLPELILKQKFKEKQTAEIFEGFKGIKSAFMEIIKDLKKGEPYYGFVVEEQFENEEIVKFFIWFDKIRAERGIKVKLIANKRYREFFKKRYKRIKTIIFRFSDLEVPMGLVITKNRLLLITWGERPTAFFIESEQLAKRFMSFFENIWEKAKP